MNLFKSNNHKSRNIPIEVDFVRACARLEMTPVWQERVQATLRVKLDWGKVWEFANHHRVLPLVYHSLQSYFQDQVPEPVMERFRMAFHTNAARNLFLSNELLTVLGWFESEGIEAISFKGAALAKIVYGDASYRQFDDLDVLVHAEDVAAVSELLQSKGYSANVTEIGQEAQNVLEHEGECSFSSPCGRVHLDVHWKMIPRVFLELDHGGLWRRSKVVTWDGQPVRVFSSEDLLVLLCIHGMRHLWARQAWICDVAQGVRVNPGLDWKVLFDRDSTFQMERFLHVGLDLASSYDELKLPDWVSDQIRADGIALKLVEDLQTSPGFHLSQHPSLLRMILLNTRARQGFPNQAHYFLGQMLSPSRRDWSLIRMPRPMRFLYGLVRPLRIFKAYGFKSLTRRLAILLGIQS